MGTQSRLQVTDMSSFSRKLRISFRICWSMGDTPVVNKPVNSRLYLLSSWQSLGCSMSKQSTYNKHYGICSKRRRLSKLPLWLKISGLWTTSTTFWRSTLNLTFRSVIKWMFVLKYLTSLIQRILLIHSWSFLRLTTRSFTMRVSLKITVARNSRAGASLAPRIPSYYALWCSGRKIYLKNSCLTRHTFSFGTDNKFSISS